MTDWAAVAYEVIAGRYTTGFRYVMHNRIDTYWTSDTGTSTYVKVAGEEYRLTERAAEAFRSNIVYDYTS